LPGEAGRGRQRADERGEVRVRRARGGARDLPWVPPASSRGLPGRQLVRLPAPAASGGPGGAGRAGAELGPPGL